MPKKQLICVSTATAFSLLAMLLFRFISLYFASWYGASVQEAFSAASSRQFGKALVIMLICTIIYLVSCFSSPKHTKIIYIVCGIISCLAGAYICMGTSIYFSGSAELQALAAPMVRLFAFTYGIAFPMFYLLQCVLACGEDLKDNIINQAITCACFVVLYFVIGFISARLIGNISMSITVSSCIAVGVTVFPSLNLENIKAQVKNKN